MIPKDPYILLSYVNTQLRDKYDSLDELCSSLSLEAEELREVLAKIGCCYNAQTNQFV